MHAPGTKRSPGSDGPRSRKPEHTPVTRHFALIHYTRSKTSTRLICKQVWALQDLTQFVFKTRYSVVSQWRDMKAVKLSVLGGWARGLRSLPTWLAKLSCKLVKQATRHVKQHPAID
ncbi:hypothetical protein IF2G_01301 [Cordyceps javanica]|nr:hypothetical protein IF2G_01301 [Cordyceps javanica]